MRKVSIIITLLLMLVWYSNISREHVSKVVIVEDTDLQFVSKWVKLNIQECPRKDLKRYTSALWNEHSLISVVKKCRQLDIPPSVVLAQMFIESRHLSQSRVSDFVKTTNNYFGIEYKNFKGINTRRYCSRTGEFIQRTQRQTHCRRSFSAFRCFDDCLQAYGQIVSRYRKDGNWKHWKTHMCKYYASNPHYSNLINIVVQVNHLNEFDTYLKCHKNENSSNRRFAWQRPLEKTISRRL